MNRRAIERRGYHECTKTIWQKVKERGVKAVDIEGENVIY
jgi:hypothetical protein